MSLEDTENINPLNESVVFLCEKRKRTSVESPFIPPAKRTQTKTPKTVMMRDASTDITPNRFADPIPFHLMPTTLAIDSYDEVLKKTRLELSEGDDLRPVVIDGSNVAVSHGQAYYNNKQGRVFSCRGILKAVDYFLKKGHKNVLAVVPQNRKRRLQHDGFVITDRKILDDLEKKKNIIFTPARDIQNKTIVCYDDKFILELASETKAVIVSNDQYRDLLTEGNPKWTESIEKRLLPYVFARDLFMVPEDPLGRTGPSLKQLLSMPKSKTGDKSLKPPVVALEKKLASDAAKSKPDASTKKKKAASDAANSKPNESTKKKKAASDPAKSKPDESTKKRIVADKARSQPTTARARSGHSRNVSVMGQRLHQRSESGASHHAPTQSAWERSARETSNLHHELCQMYPNQVAYIEMLLYRFNGTRSLSFFQTRINQFLCSRHY